MMRTDGARTIKRLKMVRNGAKWCALTRSGRAAEMLRRENSEFGSYFNIHYLPLASGRQECPPSVTATNA
jgi:3-methyladenine DNA glycosylase Tag